MNEQHDGAISVTLMLPKQQKYQICNVRFWTIKEAPYCWTCVQNVTLLLYFKITFESKILGPKT